MKMLWILILVAISFAQPKVHYYIGERINVLEGMKPGLTRELITKAYLAGCDGIVGLDQWSKNGDPATDKRWSDSMHVMCRLCDSLGLELRPFVWNGSKYHYGNPQSIFTKTFSNKKILLRKKLTLSNERKLLFIDNSEEFSNRLYDLNVITSEPVDVRFFQDTPEQPQIRKYVTKVGQNYLTLNVFDSTDFFIYFYAKSAKVFVQGLSERRPTVLEAPDIDQSAPEYLYYNQSVKIPMNPDCTAAFYGIAMRQSLLFWQEFHNEPAIKGTWFSLDEIPVCFDGQKYSDLVETASWYNYSLWKQDSWGWNDCLGGHNSQTMGVGPRETFDMQNSGPSADAPFLGFAWNESNPTALRQELALFDTGTVGVAIYLGTNNIDSAAVAICDYQCPQVLLFNWEYQVWADSLDWIVEKIKTQN